MSENTLVRSKFENVAKELNSNIQEEVFGEKVGFMSRVFGCWHGRMSKPVTTREITYRFCPNCGIRRRFDLDTFQTHGSYYYPSNGNNLYKI